MPQKIPQLLWHFAEPFRNPPRYSDVGGPHEPRIASVGVRTRSSPSGRTSRHRTAVEIKKYIKQAVLTGTRAYHLVRGDRIRRLWTLDLRLWTGQVQTPCASLFGFPEVVSCLPALHHSYTPILHSQLCQRAPCPVPRISKVGGGVQICAINPEQFRSPSSWPAQRKAQVPPAPTFYASNLDYATHFVIFCKFSFPQIKKI
jgi:hypothetical protein